jgi:hypothetical protein
MVTHNNAGLVAGHMHAEQGPARCVGRAVRKAAARRYCLAREISLEGCERIAVGWADEFSSPPPRRIRPHPCARWSQSVATVMC